MKDRGIVEKGNFFVKVLKKLKLKIETKFKTENSNLKLGLVY